MNFRVSNIQSPCMGCADRWVSEAGRCHTACKLYAEYKQKTESVRQSRAEYSEACADFNRFCNGMKNRIKSYASDEYRFMYPK